MPISSNFCVDFHGKHVRKFGRKRITTVREVLWESFGIFTPVEPRVNEKKKKKKIINLKIHHYNFGK